jgi:hypothetical protein
MTDIFYCKYPYITDILYYCISTPTTKDTSSAVSTPAIQTSATVIRPRRKTPAFASYLLQIAEIPIVIFRHTD